MAERRILTRKLQTRSHPVFKKFVHSTSGNFAVGVAFAMMPLLVGVGVAIDYSRAINSKTQMQNALDAAALAALGLPEGASKGERQKTLQTFYEENGGLGKAKLVTDLVKDPTSASLQVSSSYDMRTSMMSLVGQKKMAIVTNATVQKPVKLQTMSFKLDHVQGAWDKTVYLMARPTAADPYSPVARMAYIFPAMGAPGGITTVSKKVGAVWVDTLRMDCSKVGPCTNTILSGDGTAQADVSNMEDVYMQMDITAVAGLPYWWFKEKFRYLQSNDPATADQMFTDGKAAKKGEAVNLISVVGCSGKWIEQRWEDGGGWDGTPTPWEGTDFRYQVKGTCGTSGGTVRLTQ